MEAAYIGVNMWKQAVEKAKTTDVDKVIVAMAGQTFPAPDGFTIKMDEKNHHLWKPVFIGEVQANGQFNVVWKTPGPIKATPWCPYIPEDKGRRTSPRRSDADVQEQEAKPRSDWIQPRPPRASGDPATL